MIGWWIAAILYLCGMLMFGMAMFEEPGEIRRDRRYLQMLLWPLITLAGVAHFLFRRLTREEADNAET